VPAADGESKREPDDPGAALIVCRRPFAHGTRHTMARKKWWYASRAVLLLLTVALVAQRQHRQQPQEKAFHSSPAAPSPAGPAATARTSPSGTTKTAAAKTSAETGAYELCGVGIAPAQITPDTLGEYVSAVTKTTGDRWRGALLDSSDLRARALGLLFRYTEAKFHRPEKHEEATAKLTEDVREELVQLAAGGSDPAVYAAATWICASGTGQVVQTGACRRISLRGLASIDPDNAMPWLEVAVEDRTRGDLQSEGADFARAAAAHKSDFYQDSFLQAASAEMPPDATPLARVELDVQTVGLLAVEPLLEFSEASRFCSTEGLHGQQRQEPCEALARLWVTQGRSLLEFGMGKTLGRRLGWTQERLGKMDRELDAMMSLARENVSDPWSCQSIASDNRMLEGRAQQGEIDFLRGMLERSPPPAAGAAGALGTLGTRDPGTPKP
jgi:hypothetical protein